MKIVILCGGKGSRLNSSLEDTPKPLALVKGRPIIWHIMKLYLRYGYNEFILPLGFGGDKIKYITGDIFMLTYADGLSDVNIHSLLSYHKKMGKLATVTGVERKSQYGILDIDDTTDCVFEEEPMKKLASSGQLAVYKHESFWMSIDTQKDLSNANLKWRDANV